LLYVAFVKSQIQRYIKIIVVPFFAHHFFLICRQVAVTFWNLQRELAEGWGYLIDE